MYETRQIYVNSVLYLYMSETPENIDLLVTRVAQKREEHMNNTDFLDDEFDVIQGVSNTLKQRLIESGIEPELAQQIVVGINQMNPAYVQYNQLTPNPDDTPRIEEMVSRAISDASICETLIADARQGFKQALERLDSMYT